MIKVIKHMSCEETDIPVQTIMLPSHVAFLLQTRMFCGASLWKPDSHVYVASSK